MDKESMADIALAESKIALREAAEIICLMVGGHHDNEDGWRRIATFLVDHGGNA